MVDLSPKTSWSFIVWSDWGNTKCKTVLREAAMLAHPSPKLSIMTDASDIGIGSVVQQFVDNDWQPLGFCSRKLTDRTEIYRASAHMTENVLPFLHYMSVTRSKQLNLPSIY